MVTAVQPTHIREPTWLPAATAAQAPPASVASAAAAGCSCSRAVLPLPAPAPATMALAPPSGGWPKLASDTGSASRSSMLSRPSAADASSRPSGAKNSWCAGGVSLGSGRRLTLICCPLTPAPRAAAGCAVTSNTRSCWASEQATLAPSGDTAAASKWAPLLFLMRARCANAVSVPLLSPPCVCIPSIGLTSDPCITKLLPASALLTTMAQQQHLMHSRQAPQVCVRAVGREQHRAAACRCGDGCQGALRDAAHPRGVVLHERVAAVRQQLSVVAALQHRHQCNQALHVLLLGKDVPAVPYMSCCPCKVDTQCEL